MYTSLLGGARSQMAVSQKTVVWAEYGGGLHVLAPALFFQLGNTGRLSCLLRLLSGRWRARISLHRTRFLSMVSSMVLSLHTHGIDGTCWGYTALISPWAQARAGPVPWSLTYGVGNAELSERTAISFVPSYSRGFSVNNKSWYSNEEDMLQGNTATHKSHGTVTQDTEMVPSTLHSVFMTVRGISDLV